MEDIGNFRALSSAKNIINKNSLKYNILEKNDEKIWFVNNKVIKYFKDDKIVKKRVKRSLNLKNYIPRILERKNNLYSYEYYNGKIFLKLMTLIFSKSF